MSDLTDYHDDSVCGSCGGPLECWRDAVCCTCCPDDMYWAMVEAFYEGECDG